jgi:hypothetical protein
VECRTCCNVCPQAAVIDETTPAPGAVQCQVCPVGCWIPPGLAGACGRFDNRNGVLARNRPLLHYREAAPLLSPLPEDVIQTPVVTAIGAGGTYPDYVPAPYIVSQNRDGVDV